MNCLIILTVLIALLPAEIKAKSSGLPDLVILETVSKEMTQQDSHIFHQVIRMNILQSGLFHVVSHEESMWALAKKNRFLPETCSDINCLISIGGLIPGADYILGAFVSAEGERHIVNLKLVDIKAGLTAAAERRLSEKHETNLEFSRNITAALLKKYHAYLSGKVTADRGKRQKIQYAAFTGLFVASAALLAYRGGQMLHEDDNNKRISGLLPLPQDNLSYLRGLYAVPCINARVLGQGNAGIAVSEGEPAPLMNPAGLVHMQKQWINFIQASLPGGAPAFYLGYASSLSDKVFQSIGLRHDGDALYNETTFNAAFATDLTPVFKYMYHLALGITFKGYLVSVGKEGTGKDRATGHSLGAGCDIGLQMPLFGKIKSGILIRDAVSYLNHYNTLTNKNYEESLPPLMAIGFSYQVSPTFLLVIDGEKGVFKDQLDHIKLGASKTLFKLFQLRAGTNQIFGRETNRNITLGFGINGDVKQYSLHINYGISFGTEETSSLNNIHQFSLDVGF
jgi:hypothetical protein